MYLDEALVREIYSVARKIHGQYCSYPCFGEEDVRRYLGHLLLGDLEVRAEGTSIRTNWGIFGNTSWVHFVGSISAALDEILNKLEP